MSPCLLVSLSPYPLPEDVVENLHGSGVAGPGGEDDRLRGLDRRLHQLDLLAVAAVGEQGLVAGKEALLDGIGRPDETVEQKRIGGGQRLVLDQVALDAAGAEDAFALAQPCGHELEQGLSINHLAHRMKSSWSSWR